MKLFLFILVLIHKIMLIGVENGKKNNRHPIFIHLQQKKKLTKVIKKKAYKMFQIEIQKRKTQVALTNNHQQDIEQQNKIKKSTSIFLHNSYKLFQSIWDQDFICSNIQEIEMRYGQDIINLDHNIVIINIKQLTELLITKNTLYEKNFHWIINIITRGLYFIRGLNNQIISMKNDLRDKINIIVDNYQQNIIAYEEEKSKIIHPSGSTDNLIDMMRKNFISAKSQFDNKFHHLNKAHIAKHNLLLKIENYFDALITSLEENQLIIKNLLQSNLQKYETNLYKNNGINNDDFNQEDWQQQFFPLQKITANIIEKNMKAKFIEDINLSLDLKRNPLIIHQEYKQFFPYTTFNKDYTTEGFFNQCLHHNQKFLFNYNTANDNDHGVYTLNHYGLNNEKQDSIFADFHFKRVGYFHFGEEYKNSIRYHEYFKNIEVLYKRNKNNEKNVANEEDYYQYMITKSYKNYFLYT